MSELINRIATLDVGTPWVWQLKLSASEFAELEAAVTAQSTARLHSEQPWAQALLVYLAEWYKRCYRSGNTCPLLDARPDIKLETAWKTSGYAWKKLVYSDEGGNRRWLYSAYVLGGLAIRHELGRNDRLRFLKALCRIYHHEDYTLENLEDASRAVSFRDSIQRRHSLHHYMQEILNGNLPFNAEDLADPVSEVNRFVTAMKTANDEVMHDKFRFEWVITNTPGIATMTRALRLWLRPEEVRGGLHQYLRFDRMVLWGIKNPQALKSLKVGVRFLQGNDIVGDVYWNDAPVVFTNTGDEETGFLAVNVERCAICNDVPTQPFDTILVVARDNNDKEYELQREKAPDLLQLWREPNNIDRWTSAQNTQRDTAVLFSPVWHLQLDNTSEAVQHKPFRSKRHGKSEPWGWYIIYDKATLMRGDEEITLYNRQGYDRIATRLYLDTIQYENGGYVNYTDRYGDEELLPLIFGSEDVVARHFATKDDITDAQPDDETEIELIEYKQGAYYAEWTADNRPPYGKVTLRLTVKGRQMPFEACLLPRLAGESPIVRDFDNCTIRYATIGEDGNASEQVVRDNIPMDFNPLSPAIALNICNAEVKVYRPTLIKEVYLDRNITCYLQDGEQLNLPYIFKRRVAIADFSRQGYRRYDCDNLATVFAEPFINISGNPNAGMAALAAWENNMRYPATALDNDAPDYLFVIFGNPKGVEAAENERFCFWNYAEGTAPKAVAHDNAEARERWGIIFHDLQDAATLTCRFPIINDDDTWADEMDYISEFDCFLQGVAHEVYFFQFMPLRNMDKSEYADKLYRPLMELRGGTLTEQDLDGLLRFAEEFDFDFNKIINCAL